MKKLLILVFALVAITACTSKQADGVNNSIDSVVIDSCQTDSVITVDTVGVV